MRITSHPLTSEMPRTARWRWDDDSDLHYIGSKCGTSWCSIYSNATQLPPLQWTSDDRPRSVIPGWFDEQHLAVWSDGELRPGPFGRIDASQHLASDTVDLDVDIPVHVADITFAPPVTDLGPYLEKFNLFGRDGGTFRSEIWLNRNQSTAFFRNRSIVGVGVEAASVQYVQVSNHSAAGSNRWRWLDGEDGDEGAWIYCIDGCCSVEGA